MPRRAPTAYPPGPHRAPVCLSPQPTNQHATMNYEWYVLLAIVVGGMLVWDILDRLFMGSLLSSVLPSYELSV